MPDRRRTCSFRPVPHVGVALRLCMLLVLGCLPLLPTPVAAAHAPLLVEATTGRTRLPVRAAAPVAPLVASQSLTATTTLTGTETRQTFAALPVDAPALQRSEHTATLLQDGTVLVAGGMVDGEGTASAELFDPATNTFMPTGSLNGTRYSHTATLLQNGKVLIAGGIRNNTRISSAELYDPATGTFTETGAMKEVRSDHAAVLLKNGNVLLIDGSVNSNGYAINTAELYDWRTGSFTATGNPTYSGTNVSATLLADGDVLLINDGTMDRYDVATGTFTYTFSVSNVANPHQATLLPDGTVLVVSSRIIVYDPSRNQVTLNQANTTDAKDFTATRLQSGDVMIVGARNESGTDQPDARLYHFNTSTVERLAAFTLPHVGHTATLLPDGDVLLTGGTNSTGTSERIHLASQDTFTGVLAYPTDWITATTPLSLTVSSTSGTLNRGNINAGPQVAVEEGVPVTMTLGTTPATEADTALVLHLSEQDGTQVSVRFGMATVDTVAPSGKIDDLPITSPASFTLEWISGSDAGSGIASYDVDVRDGLDQPWQPLLRSTTLISTTFNGTPDHTYFFRLRIRDVAGNVSAWQHNADAITTIRSGEPTTTFQGMLASPRTMLFRSLSSGVQDADTTALLPDGKGLFASGGERHPDNLAFIYDTVTEALTQTTNTNWGRLYGSSFALGDGSVLIYGGHNGGLCGCEVEIEERFDPVTRTFTILNDTNTQEFFASTNRVALQDSTVLLLQDANEASSSSRALLYDTATDTITTTATFQQERTEYAVTLLPSGKVLVAGGYTPGAPDHALASAEVYDPATGTWTLIGNLETPRVGAAAIALNNGLALIAGGSAGVDRSALYSAELFDPATGTFTPTGDLLQVGETYQTQTLPDGSVVVTSHPGASSALKQRYDTSSGTFEPMRWTVRNTPGLDTATPNCDAVRVENKIGRGCVFAANTFSGTLTLPSGWITTTTTVSFTGDAMIAPLEAASLDDGLFTALEPDEVMTATLSTSTDGSKRPVTLRLRDANGLIASVVRGEADIDQTAPTSTIKPLMTTSFGTFTVKWSGTDATSGIAGYDVEVRDGDEGDWTPALTNTMALTTTFTGENAHTYFFRVRARDVAGNVEAWPDTSDTQTEVDTVPPTGGFRINRGARATTGREVTIEPNMTDRSGVPSTRINLDGTWSDWQSNFGFNYFTLPNGDGEKVVVMQFRDGLGNTGDPITRTILLDRTVGTTPGVSIADGADFTNVPTVTLEISAPTYTTEMMISNDGGFGGAKWQPYDAHPTWRISTAGGYRLPRTVYVRTRAWARGDIVQSTQDDIIFDPQPPTGEVEITSVGATTVKVRTPASDPDDLSRVARVRVSLNAQFTGATWQPYRQDNPVSTLARSGSGAVTVYAQWEDGAGNLSAVRSASTNQNATATPTRTTGPSVTPTPTPSASPTATRTAQPSPTTTAPRDSHVYLPLVRR